jgi:anti-sigma28 factor (negative regulator of flagellin synthesis)
MTAPVSSALSSTVADRAAAPAAAGSAAADPAPAGASEGSDSVELSDQADAAGTMLSAAQETGSDAANPALARIAQDIADGIYRPPPAAIAEALVRYETRLLQGG